MDLQLAPGVTDRDASEQAEMQAVLLRVADHDEQAVGLFYDLTLSRIYGLILRVVRNPADAEEVVGIAQQTGLPLGKVKSHARRAVGESVEAGADHACRTASNISRVITGWPKPVEDTPPSIPRAARCS